MTHAGPNEAGVERNASKNRLRDYHDHAAAIFTRVHRGALLRTGIRSQQPLGNLDLPGC